MNSELDLFEAFHNHAGDKRIPEVVADMKKELGKGNKKPEILEKLAQYELTLLESFETTVSTPSAVTVLSVQPATWYFASPPTEKISPAG